MRLSTASAWLSRPLGSIHQATYSPPQNLNKLRESLATGSSRKLQSQRISISYLLCLIFFFKSKFFKYSFFCYRKNAFIELLFVEIRITFFCLEFLGTYLVIIYYLVIATAVIHSLFFVSYKWEGLSRFL